MAMVYTSEYLVQAYESCDFTIMHLDSFNCQIPNTEDMGYGYFFLIFSGLVPNLLVSG